MKEVLLAKEEGLRIAISILSGKATNKDFGSAALKDAELILKNILETMQIEQEMTAKPQVEPKKPNKKRALSLAQKKEIEVNNFAAKELMPDRKKITILKLEEGNK